MCCSRVRVCIINSSSCIDKQIVVKALVSRRHNLHNLCSKLGILRVCSEAWTEEFLELVAVCNLAGNEEVLEVSLNLIIHFLLAFLLSWSKSEEF